MLVIKYIAVITFIILLEGFTAKERLLNRDMVLRDHGRVCISGPTLGAGVGLGERRGSP